MNRFMRWAPNWIYRALRCRNTEGNWRCERWLHPGLTQRLLGAGPEWAMNELGLAR